MKTRGRRGTRLALGASMACVAAILAWIVIGLFAYVNPAADPPEKADVVFVLGPPDRRLSYAEQLVEQGYASTLAVSVPLDEKGEFDSPICRAPKSYRVVCFNPKPFTTQGEARSLVALSEQYGWHRADVVTAQFHVARARVIVDRCVKDGVRVVSYRDSLPLVSVTNPVRSWAYQYVYQSAAFVKAALNPEC